MSQGCGLPGDPPGAQAKPAVMSAPGQVVIDAAFATTLKVKYDMKSLKEIKKVLLKQLSRIPSDNGFTKFNRKC